MYFKKFFRNHATFALIVIVGIVILVFGIVIFGDGRWGEWYYNRIFVPLNLRWQSILQISDVPYYIVALFALFTILIIRVMSGIGRSWRTNLGRWLLFVSSAIILLVSLFYWLWGFNYGRTTIGESYFHHVYIAPDSNTFKSRWKMQTFRVNSFRSQITLPDREDKHLTREYAQIFQHTADSLSFFFGLDSRLKPRCKEFIPAGFLLRLNTAGFYFPYFSESYVDKALHITQKPFVIAHELAHGYGVTDEGEANFIGYILCQSSGDLLARYSAALSLWLYMAWDARHLDPDFVQSMWDSFSTEVRLDMEERRSLDEKYPEFMPRMRDAIYQSYLSMNRVEGGLKSYNRFVKMVLTYEGMKNAE